MQCFLCYEKNSVELLNLGKQPLANKYPRTEDFEAEDFFPLQTFACPRCKNVQLGTMVSRERMFVDYYYLSSVNPGLVRHFEDFAKKLSRAQFVLDVGSNDGIFLKPLKELGVKVLGVEPSENVSKIANDAGFETLTAFFDTETVVQIKEKYGMPDIVVASSVFTHLENPHQFIEDVKDVMTEDGAFIIEVEYIGNIVNNIQFERFYLDRIFYYSLTSLKHLFELHDLYIADVEYITTHGGSLRVTARKSSAAEKPHARVERFLQKETGDLSSEKFEQFKRDVEANIAALRSVLEAYKRAGIRVAGYGAPARVTTITNYGNIGPSLIEFIVDDSPLKQNKFSPGMHIPIYPKQYLDAQNPKPDVLVVFAYEYFDDIKKKTQNSRYRYLMPIPPKELA